MEISQYFGPDHDLQSSNPWLGNFHSFFDLCLPFSAVFPDRPFPGLDTVIVFDCRQQDFFPGVGRIFQPGAAKRQERAYFRRR